ncbi:organic solute transporter alpha-like protein [Cephus cinctus]|uniref:Organic solute transporter alpha-like protein n=1 Tax=Cephus cinctus TaxID=211228 RepID=A0AAJ7C9Z6_CEPCN|nr:organic solute transporter alpha-like protein [Cephus cinctus]
MGDEDINNFYLKREMDNYRYNTCDYAAIPSAAKYMESLGVSGVGMLSIGSLFSAITLYIAIDACYNVLFQKETTSYKTNSYFILFVYPVASLSSLLAIAIPRAQLLSEAVTQIFLTISLYRLFLLLIDVGRRNVTKPPPLMLKVGPCCCWPCLPFPTLELSTSNLSWLRALVLQLPFVQGIAYCVLLFLAAEQPTLAERYVIYLQPFCVVSILLGIYGLTVTTKSLQEIAPESNLHYRTMVSQIVLLFTKLQAALIKNLPSFGVFPCKPPLTPPIYAGVTYNALMLIEMLLLCYAASLIYKDSEKQEDCQESADKPKVKTTPADVTNNNETVNVQLSVQVPVTTS